MSTRSDLSLSQQVESLTQFVLHMWSNAPTATLESLKAGRQSIIETLNAEIAELEAELPAVPAKWRPTAEAELATKKAAVPVQWTDEMGMAELHRQWVEAARKEAQTQAGLMGLTEIVVPVKPASERKARFDVTVNGNRLLLNSELVHAFTYSDVVIIPNSTSLPEEHPAHSAGVTLWGKVINGKFVELDRSAEKFNSASGLMKLVLGESAQGVNRTPFTANDNSRAGTIVTKEELARLVA